MADIGLILGGALAGGLQGAGAAGVGAIHTQQEQEGKEDLVKLQTQLEEQKDLRIMEAKQGYDVTNQNSQFAHMDLSQANEQKFTGGENDKSRANAVTLTGMNNATTIRAAGISAGASLQGDIIRANSAKYAADLAANKQTMTADATGKMFLLNERTGGTTPVLDSQTGKQLTSAKDIPASVQLTAKSYMDQAHAALTMDPKDPTALALMDTARAMLGVQTPEVPKSPPSDASVARLIAHPEMAGLYDAQYGKGQAAATLAAAAAKKAATPAAPTTPAVKPAGLVNSAAQNPNSGLIDSSSLL